MPLESRFDPDQSLLICTVTGEFTFDQVMDLHEQCFEKFHAKNLIVDLRTVSLQRLQTQHIEIIARMSEKKKNLRPANSKTALVAKSPVNYGLSRMYQTFSELKALPWHFDVFKSMVEALEWIAEEDAFHPGHTQIGIA